MSDDVNSFLFQQGSKSFTFENPGDKIDGVIISMDKRAQTDPVTGKVRTFESGQAQEMVVITLQTDLHEDTDDDGIRSIYMKGGNFSPTSGRGTSGVVALRDALIKANAKGLQVGGRLIVAHTGLSKRNVGAAKLYMAKYEPPTASIALDDIFGDAADSNAQQRVAQATGPADGFGGGFGDEEPF